MTSITSIETIYVYDISIYDLTIILCMYMYNVINRPSYYFHIISSTQELYYKVP